MILTAKKPQKLEFNTYIKSWLLQLLKINLISSMKIKNVLNKKSNTQHKLLKGDVVKLKIFINTSLNL